MSDVGETAAGRRRVRELLGSWPGTLPPGPLNAITDVDGVLVGHVTLIEGTDVRTGVTAVRPHPGNVFAERVPAGLVTANGFGKLIGSTQVEELGELETPIVLTNTLAAARAAAALTDWMLALPGNAEVTSINPFVGETNDGKLNDIRRPSVTSAHVERALEEAAAGPVAEGAVGAGTGTVAFGYKGGIGTSSRVVSCAGQRYTVGVLVQSNFGGDLNFAGLRLPEDDAQAEDDADGSIMIIVATDAPLSDRNLRRLAFRAHGGLARTGAGFSNGSGDYAVAFSTAAEVRRSAGARFDAGGLGNTVMNPLFMAAVEATEEAVLNSLAQAEAMTGYRGLHVPALPLARLGRF